MSRIIFLLVVIVVVFFLLRAFRKPAPKQDVPATTEDMVRCAVCGVHLPKSESILAGGKNFCSEAHRNDFQSK